MSIATIEKTFQEAFSTWSSTPVTFENIPPIALNEAGQPLLADGEDDFILVEVDVTDTQTVQVPHSCVRYFGFLSVDIYVKENTGTRNVAEYMDELNTMFLFKRLSGDLRVKEFLSDGSYRVANGWVIYACQWPFETEY